MSEVSGSRPGRRQIAAAFLIAGALIVFQVSFTRLISYKLFYHFVFLAISLSLLGLGAAGTYVAVRRPPASLDRSIARWTSALAVSVPIAFLLIANPFGITHHPPIRTKLLGTDAIAYLLWCSPLMVWLNFCGGVVLTTLFRRHSEHMGMLYAADLLGAATGSLACIALMKHGSPPVAFVSAVVAIGAAAAACLAALPAADAQRRVGAAVVALAAVISCAIFIGPERYRNFQNFRTEGGKPLRKILKYEWSHLIRTDHVPNWYVLDGEAATQITPWTANARRRPPTKPEYSVAPDKPSVAIIGVGGGRQLAEALRADASAVLAIDINPTILRWVRGEDRALTQDLFFDPRVETHVGEGRHAVRSAGRAFDVIVIHAIDTYAAAASGAYALTENFLYTKEAFLDYSHALTEQGVVSISRWLFNPPRENLRVFATALAALRERGVADPTRHVAVVAPVADYERLGERRVWGYVLVANSPFTAERLRRLREDVSKRKWSMLFDPDRPTGTPFDELARTTDVDAFQRSYPYVVTPVTDSSPYLFQFYNPLHRTAYRRDGDWATAQIYQWSAITLLVTLALATALSCVLILAPLLWVKRHASAATRPTITPRHTVYFAGLGVGYMALEIPIIQALSLYLGHPTYGFSVVLVALLFTSGLGSLLVERLDVRPSVVCTYASLFLATVAVTIFPFIQATLDWPAPARFAAAIGITGACGLPLGMPLALGVRALGQEDDRSVAWAWGINGAASVVGACVIMIVLVFAGSVPALFGAALCYATAALASMRLTSTRGARETTTIRGRSRSRLGAPEWTKIQGPR